MPPPLLLPVNLLFMARNNMKKGFTLIEFLLYIGLAAVILVVMTMLLNGFLDSRFRSQSVAEVEQQGLAAIQEMIATVRVAEVINSPSSSNSSTTLSLKTSNASTTPTLFFLNNGVLMIQEGASSSVALTNDLVDASSLNFKNLMVSNATGTIQINFRLDRANVGKSLYQYGDNFSASASLR